MELLERAYVKKVNKRFARYLLLTCKQKSGETLEDFVHGLKKLGADCEFEALTVNEHKEMAIGDAFVAGLQSSYVRQRLLEGKEDTLQGLIDKAKSIEDAQKNSEMYRSSDRGQSSLDNSTLAMQSMSVRDEGAYPQLSATLSGVGAGRHRRPSGKGCGSCGNPKWHPKSRCPARDEICYKCKWKGHFAKCCRNPSAEGSLQDKPARASVHTMVSNYAPNLFCLNAMSALPGSKVNLEVQVNGCPGKALFDSGATDNHISAVYMQNTAKWKCQITMIVYNVLT